MRKQEKKETETLQFEITFYEKIIRDNPDYIEALKALADSYTKIGEHKKGLNIDKRLALLQNNDETVFYNLACSYALLKMSNKAFEALEKAVSLGYNDISHMQADTDLDSIRKDDRFIKIIGAIQQKRK